ncbi:MAG TPA: sensor histidine kinase [Albidovulum sp.]|uniref:sensor histidine kinase n=1 Tax=Albidovulum sp. TaxID=1872424 RepID=UPI002C7229C2|nr:sensor histidine kinase [Albidovulum sp.]
MSEARGPRKRFIDRLGFRLGLVLSMALLPIGLLAVLQARSLMDEARARSEAALAGETLRVLLPELRLIRQGQGASEVLASVVPILLPQGTGDSAACDRVMRDTVGASSIYSYAAFVAVDGAVSCASDRKVEIPVDLARLAELSPPDNVALISANQLEDGSPTGVAAVHPVTAADGALLGYTFVNMPHSRLSAAAATMATRKDNFALILFDDEGRILAANRDSGDATELLPGDRSLLSLADGASQTFTAPDTSGIARSFSVIKLSDVNIFALGSWPAEADTFSFVRNIPAIVFPLLMWAACLVAAWLAAENLVTTYIRRLRRAITHFAGGNREVIKLDMTGAPLEIREVSDSFEQMTETILHDEAELENSLHQKEVLLREVHHRVKNNLQLIASIMSMQMRKTKSTEAKSLMKGLQDRVMSLATIHKGLYQTSGMADIRVDELFPEIVHQVIRMASGPERRIQATTEFDDLNLTPDQAVPLALLLTEAMTNAMKYAESGANAAGTELRVSFRRIGGDMAQLVVENSSGGSAAPDEVSDGSGLGTQLIEAFARQLNGTLDRREGPDSYRLSLVFPLHALTEAEARQNGSPIDNAAE